jgi:hypothetical protein
LSSDSKTKVAAPDQAVLAGLSEQARDGTKAGQPGVGIGIVPRDEDESALMGARMRQRQSGIVANLVVAGDDVDVEGTRPPSNGPHPAECPLDALAAVKH